ncbi:MAG: hypothetical protein IKQ41_09150 [Clostridia bacterium]|nr:hypothetical protein [Clostridia bacterium]
MKSEPARTWIAAPETLKIEALLGGRPEFMILGGDADGRGAARSVLAAQPDFLILEDTLRSADGYWVLDQLRQSAVCPPRVLFLCACGESAWTDLAARKGADAVLSKACAPADFLRSALETVSLPLPRLSAPMEAERLKIAEALIDELGVRDRFLGRRDMICACAALACAPWMQSSLSIRLYPYVAGQRGASPRAVEKAIRTAVEDTWLRGDLKAIGRLFGFSVDAERGKPTNAEFLAMIAQHVRTETQKRLDQIHDPA